MGGSGEFPFPLNEPTDLAAVAPILVGTHEFPVRGRDALRTFGQLGAVG
jgi:hypothetical protein